MLSAHILKIRRELTVEVAFDLKTGGSLALFGPSGAGKSTVLACMSGVESPDHGHLSLGGKTIFPPPIALHRRGIGYLTQEPSLFPHLRVRENVTFGVTEGELRLVETRNWVEILCQRLRLDAIWEASAGRISGGQARRVALARMLARRPSLVLLDEPFAGLDRQLVRELINHLIFWNQTLGFSMIVVDHQIENLRRLCPDDAIAMEEGRIIQRGTWADLTMNPATECLRSLLSPL